VIATGVLFMENKKKKIKTKIKEVFARDFPVIINSHPILFISFIFTLIASINLSSNSPIST
jgi:hypothetical protein